MNGFMKKFLILLGFCLVFPLFAEENHNFELYTMSGKLLSTSEIMRKPEVKYLIVDFFSLICEPCKKSLPKWDEFYKSNKSKGFEFIVISLPPEKGGGKKQERELKEYFKKNKFSFTMVFDKYFLVGKKFGAVSKSDDITIPMIFVLDKSGKILFKAESYDEAVSKISDLK